MILTLSPLPPSPKWEGGVKVREEAKPPLYNLFPLSFEGEGD